jgi:hypothetical protein
MCVCVLPSLLDCSRWMSGAIIDERTPEQRSPRYGATYSANYPPLAASDDGGLGATASVWEPEPTYDHRCSRRYVFALSGALLLLSAAGVALVWVYALTGCTGCGTAAVQGTAIGAAVAIVALLGIFAAALRKCCLSVLFGLLLTLGALALIAATVIAIKPSWARPCFTFAVQNDADAVCAAQQRLGCSGFDTCCAITVNSTLVRQAVLANTSRRDLDTKYPCGLYSEVPDWFDSQCAPTCRDKYAAKACGAVLDSNRVLIASSGFSAAGVLLLSLVCVARMTISRDGPDPPQAYLLS